MSGLYSFDLYKYEKLFKMIRLVFFFQVLIMEPNRVYIPSYVQLNNEEDEQEQVRSKVNHFYFVQDALFLVTWLVISVDNRV